MEINNIDKKIEEFQNTSFKWCDLEDGNGMYIAGWQVEEYLKQALLDIQKETASRYIKYLSDEQLIESLENSKRETGGLTVYDPIDWSEAVVRNITKQLTGEDYE